ncbi:MAG: hypothetical protein V9E83_08405 [Baekduia sp.]
MFTTALLSFLAAALSNLGVATQPVPADATPLTEEQVANVTEIVRLSTSPQLESWKLVLAKRSGEGRLDEAWTMFRTGHDSASATLTLSSRKRVLATGRWSASWSWDDVNAGKDPAVSPADAGTRRLGAMPSLPTHRHDRVTVSALFGGARFGRRVTAMVVPASRSEHRFNMALAPANVTLATIRGNWLLPKTQSSKAMAFRVSARTRYRDATGRALTLRELAKRAAKGPPTALLSFNAPAEVQRLEDLSRTTLDEVRVVG